jgi:hypothetical protein
VTPAGSSCDETICLNDFLATAAAIAGVEKTDEMGPDSHNILALYQGGQRDEHPPVIHHDFDGGMETVNVIGEYPEVAAALERVFKAQVMQGRSTLGPDEKNVEDVDWMLPFSK